MFGSNTILPVLPLYTALYLQRIQTCNVSVCIIKHEAMKACGGSWSIDSRIPNLGSSWRLVVRFSFRPLYTQSNSGRFTLNKRLYRPRRAGHFGDEKEFLVPPVNRIPVPAINDSLRPSVMQDRRYYTRTGQLKCDGTCAETRFRRSAKRTSPFKSAVHVSSVDYWQSRCAHQR